MPESQGPMYRVDVTYPNTNRTARLLVDTFTPDVSREEQIEELISRIGGKIAAIGLLKHNELKVFQPVIKDEERAFTSERGTRAFSLNDPLEEVRRRSRKYVRKTSPGK
jgi:hypothetical protein